MNVTEVFFSWRLRDGDKNGGQSVCAELLAPPAATAAAATAVTEGAEGARSATHSLAPGVYALTLVPSTSLHVTVSHLIVP